MVEDYLFTSESVTEGHPDKMCDQISDAILDQMLAGDPKSRVACETLITTGLVVLAGEITSNASVDFQKTVRDIIREIGYDNSEKGFDCDTCAVMVVVDKQSPDIAQGVNSGEGLHKEQGAGDQGLMFGYAIDESPELMPLPISLAHKLSFRMSQVRKNGELPYLRPDGKSQVTIQYKDGMPHKIDTVVLSCQHDEEITHDQITKDLKEKVGKHILPDELIDGNTKWHINPTGRFVLGGPLGDAGLTGRKIIVDTYGGAGRHGGGAFSGKDPSKVDRSAAYAARYVAKNIVKSGAARKCEVQLAYAIGFAKPVSLRIHTFNTSVVDEKKLQSTIEELFPLTPHWIIDELNLLRPIYKKTAAYGHFGREDIGFSWEKTDKSEEIKAALGL